MFADRAGMNTTQAKEYLLKSMLNSSVPVDIPAALECFRRHYRANPEKLELLLNIGTAAVLYTLHDIFDPLSLRGSKVS